MIWAKKKKMIVITGSIGLVLVVPQAASIPFYTKSSSAPENVTNGSQRINNSELLKGTQGVSKQDNSNRDQNLKPEKQAPKEPIVTVKKEEPKPVAPKVEKKPEEKPVIIKIAPKVEPVVPPVVIKEIPKPEPAPTPVTPVVKEVPKVEPTPVTPVAQPVPAPKPEPVVPKETPPTTGSLIPGPDEEVISAPVTIEINDPTLKGIDDKGQHYTGGYRTITVSTKILVKKAPPRHKFSAEDKVIENRVPYSSNIVPEIVNIEVTDQLISEYRKSYLAQLKFDIEHGIGYDRVTGINWKNQSNIPNDKIDWDNLKLTASAVEKMKKGEVLSIRNLYINKQGEIDANSWGPLSDKFNNTISLYGRDNEKYRTFGYKQWYARTPDKIKDGDFPGWTKKDVTTDWQNSNLGLAKDDGITVFQYSNNDPTFAKNNGAFRVILDAANEKGYSKYISFLKKVSADPSKKITSFVIKNMGLGKEGSNQKFKPILEALPNEISNLELWLEQPTATSYLEALRHKKIDELSLYTTGNSLRQEWSINPLSVQNTAFITYQDYNVSSDFQAGYKPATRVNISTFAFDPDNYDKTAADPYKEINLGLRMAYLVRNNERFFQGEHGRGVENPDNSEGTNTSWPNLDLSRIPELKSLRGLKFDFTDGNGKSFSRKVSRLTLYNDSPVFTISVDELNNSQFHHVMYLPPSPGNPTDRLMFKGTSGVNALRIVSNGTNRLTPEGLQNLATFYRQVGKDVFVGGPIYVNSGDPISAILTSNGYTTKVYSGNVDTHIN